MKTNQSARNGAFVISLDFELFWGVRDKKSFEQYGDAVRNVHQVVPELLKLMGRYEIHATWATVGFLFAENKQHLIEGSPTKKPQYVNSQLSPYQDLPHVGQSEEDDPHHYAQSLVKMIQEAPSQEVGSHTFSHYYCLEKGQNCEDFRADLEAAKAIANDYGIELSSLVFPRNQYDLPYLAIASDLGFKTYRGNPGSYLYQPGSERQKHLFKRILKFFDTYINLTGHHIHAFPKQNQSEPLLNIPASRFLRPYSKQLGFSEGLKLRRIKQGMKQAAKQGKIFHLWWHPHNFGRNLDQNMRQLEDIFAFYQALKEQHGFESLNMEEITTRCGSMAVNIS